MRVTLRAINAELARQGHHERLVRGPGYFYFTEGEADFWFETMVVRPALGNSLQFWIDEHAAKKKSKDNLLRRL